MYVFPEELRKAYESMPSAFVYVQYIDGTVVPLLVSDGFCRLVGMERDMFMSWYREHIFDMIHPDDVVRVEKTGMEFADHRGDFDLVFRARHEDRYRVIHSVGSWQTMHDGTELALMTYMDISDNFREMTEGKDESSLFRTDEFYTDPLTGLPNLNYLNQLADRRIDLLRAEGKTPVLIYADVISMQFY
ncbi:MAG: PAS domain-containing protein, partial [Lachnospiraceae bacterium]|nr:PAS domain-containing protein [Lachnospiraceae bacterium]